ncbi:DUF6873 family GME fold protein [Hathewaya proteolytica]|uniref:DUF6873 family GME fold protein n=1 Tax=Hathewaya proteolytica TaxID=29365 RepID=UPI00093391AA|nr:hypothetical protein [Hathewaya proteolytica]
MAKYTFVDSRISNEEYSALSYYCPNIIKVPSSSLLYPSVCGHPDMLLHILDANRLMVHKDMDEAFVDTLLNYGFEVIHSAESLSYKYPGDIILNAASSKSMFIHNLKYTDEKLMDIMKKRQDYNKNFTMIDVPQGYTKCSLAVLGYNCFITSDKPIYNKLHSMGYNILYVPPGNILLPGLDYGFIGGCCGIIDDNTVAFYGNLNFYKYGKEVISFLKKCGIDILYLSKSNLVDRGSILSCDFNGGTTRI